MHSRPLINFYNMYGIHNATFDFFKERELEAGSNEKPDRRVDFLKASVFRMKIRKQAVGTIGRRRRYNSKPSLARRFSPPRSSLRQSALTVWQLELQVEVIENQFGPSFEASRRRKAC